MSSTDIPLPLTSLRHLIAESLAMTQCVVGDFPANRTCQGYMGSDLTWPFPAVDQPHLIVTGHHGDRDKGVRGKCQATKAIISPIRGLLEGYINVADSCSRSIDDGEFN